MLAINKVLRKFPRQAASLARAFSDEIVHMTFVTSDGKKVAAEGKTGENLVEVAHKFGVQLEGACECSLACSTCHVILDPKSFDSLGYPCEDEDDLLDLAPCLSETSRLGCQVLLKPELEGMVAELPPMTRNFYVDQ